MVFHNTIKLNFIIYLYSRVVKIMKLKLNVSRFFSRDKNPRTPIVERKKRKKREGIKSSWIEFRATIFPSREIFRNICWRRKKKIKYMRRIIEWYISDGKLFRKYREKIIKKKGEKEKERKKKHDFPPETRFLLEKSKRPTCCRDKQWHYGNPRRSTFSASRRIGSLASIRSFVRSLSLRNKVPRVF